MTTIVAVTLLTLLPAFGQGVRVGVGKGASPIPEACESVAPASLDPTVDIPALVREAVCRGSGEIIADYTYVLDVVKRQKRPGKSSDEEATTYEVYAPTLKTGTRGRGVLLVTRRNGVPVPPAELEKARLRAGEELEKEEKRIAVSSVDSPAVSDRAAAVLPAGTYPNLAINREFGRGAELRVQTFLTACNLVLVKREQTDGRDSLVFRFSARQNVSLVESERYIGKLTGVVWIDARDRIVTRLLAWPSEVINSAGPDLPANGLPPAIHIEMHRVPEGAWLASFARMNGADYPALFDDVAYDSILRYSEYKRFKTGIQDVKLETPRDPR
jgi:hypothetical protein